MFGFFKKRLLEEHKKLIWQNFHGSRDMLERLREHSKIIHHHHPEGKPIIDSHIKKCEEVRAIAANIVNNWTRKEALNENDLENSWEGNKTLRIVYDQTIKKTDFFHRSFDDFVNPPYGWKEALEDFDNIK
jgi:hypothetical protein